MDVAAVMAPGSGSLWYFLKGSDLWFGFCSKRFLFKIVAAVRLLRIERGGAFADLLNVKGKNSGKNEMDYVERTLGFRTRELDNLDIRLVTEIVGGTVRWRRYFDYLISSLAMIKGSLVIWNPYFYK
ncbi:ribosomal RNA small subunit methyltransferase B [Carex littledalei]|uniref:Ribosomal RNA small subunit methyltransferase B n=1 Tax=Carex littledalei TaxID=544730 RepID=A0A833VGK2_9POAL|nr:ribosomal RNA small subunit methyltransferase B [Carex littledalei]